MTHPPPDWQLPPGTDRGVWDYAHNPDLARGYDDALRGTPLLEHDLRFAARHFPAPGRLIDLGCGTGRLLVPFAERGFECLGVDLSEEMLDVLGAKAREAGVSVARVRANLVELDAVRDGAFDYAACLFSTLGMVRGRANRDAALRHVFRVLRPGGTFVLHAHNRWHALRERSGRAWLLWNLWGALRGRDAAGDRTMPQHLGGAPLTLHHFTRGEIVRALRRAGFEVVAVEPVTTGGDGRLRRPWLLGGLRAYGYLIACRRPGRATDGLP